MAIVSRVRLRGIVVMRDKEALMDKIEKDDVITNNKIFEEADDMFDYDKDSCNEDNSDIVDAIDGDKLGNWDNF